ncbi:hypothetical protein MSAN_01723100 [Mycena sanguinolenta]|uniref:Uncharacterized protein n=1 Tax=Mycena sanguinolenta TaxID=230812 RepID=A0A8H6XW60_9AGAR|nr:hypothetical protein MSAN_01723100 [Mycena sanguinolenta]
MSESKPAPIPHHVPAHIAEFLATQPTGSTPQQVFESTIKILGSYDAAVSYFQNSIDVTASGAVIGADRPPPNAEVKETTVGPLTIFYHSTYPRHLQHRAPFTWSFYIGWRGKGQDSIMLVKEWLARGIRVDIVGFTGRWEECGLLMVTGSTRVRITYDVVVGEERVKGAEELVFPRQPRDASIPIQFLELAGLPL